MKLKVLGLVIGTLLLGGLLIYSIQSTSQSSLSSAKIEESQTAPVVPVETKDVHVYIPNYVPSLFTEVVLTVGDFQYEFTDSTFDGGEPIQVPVDTPGILTYKTPWEEEKIEISQFDREHEIDLPVMTEDVVEGLKKAIVSTVEEMTYMNVHQTLDHFETVSPDRVNEFAEMVEERFKYSETLEAYRIHSVKAAFKDYFDHWFIQDDQVVVYVTETYDYATYYPTEQPVFESRKDTTTYGFSYDAEKDTWIQEYVGVGYGHVIKGAEELSVNKEIQYPDEELVALKTEQYLDPTFDSYEDSVAAFHYQQSMDFSSFHFSLLVGIQDFLRGEESVEEYSVKEFLASESPLPAKLVTMRDKLLAQDIIVDFKDTELQEIAYIDEVTINVVSRDEVTFETSSGEQQKVYTTTMVYKKEDYDWRLYDLIESIEN